MEVLSYWKGNSWLVEEIVPECTAYHNFLLDPAEEAGGTLWLTVEAEKLRRNIVLFICKF